MKNKLGIIGLAVLVAVVLVYFGASVIPTFFSSGEISVEPARAIVYRDTLTVSGIVLRSEVPVNAKEAPASVDYKVSDGDRVSIGDPVASYSSSPTSAGDRLAVETIDRRIKLLEECIDATSQYDLNTLDSRTKESLKSYLDVSEKGDLSVSLEASDEILSYFIKRDIKATGDKSHYKQILDNCIASRDAILNSSSAQHVSVYAPLAGYFSSQYDGYEFLNTSDYPNATPETVHSLLAKEPEARPSGYVGKLQHFSFWTYLCTVPESEQERFPVGSNWSLLFKTAAYGTQSVDMTVISASKPENGEIALVFECSFFNEALYSLRISEAQIVLTNYSGFRVKKDAIRVSEGQTGVYVLSAAKLVFKPVTVLYRNEESNFAVVVPAVESSARTLILNDSVVVGGKEIYDGKVVNIN